LKDWNTNINNKEKEENNKKLQIYAEGLIKKLDQAIRDKEREFTGIPLQCRMLAEAFDEGVKTFCQAVESIPDLSFDLDLLVLYRRFINRKYDIYQEEKCRVPTDNVIAKEQRESDLKNMREDHYLLALKELFTEEQLKVLQTNRQQTFEDSKLGRIGIAQVSHYGKLHFIHRTFAEYYVADYLVNRLTEGNKTSQQVQTFTLKVVFREAECQVIRVFMDAFLSQYELSTEVLKKYGNQIHKLREDGELALHQSAREGNAKVTGILLHSLEVAGHTDTLFNLLLAQDKERKPACHVSFVGGHTILEKLMKNVEDKLIIKFMLKKGKDRQTAWHVALRRGKVEVLDRLWEWAKKVLNRDELNNKLLLARDEREKTVLHHAIFSENVQILERVWKWANEQLTPEKLKEIVLAHDTGMQTAWPEAVQWGKVEVLDKMWELAKKVLNRDELNNKLLLAREDTKKTFLHHAAFIGDVQILERVWKWANEQLTPEELNKLFLAQDYNRRTVWHLAVDMGEVEVLDKLWEWAKEVLNRDELINELLLAKDDEEKTALHHAILSYDIQIFERILKWANEQLSQEELKELLLAENDHGRTAWHVAVNKGEIEKLDELWVWAKEVLNRDELDNKLLLAKDVEEKTALHHAILSYDIQILERILKWANEQLSQEELK
jgi:ankyrin repeat protein